MLGLHEPFAAPDPKSRALALGNGPELVKVPEGSPVEDLRIWRCRMAGDLMVVIVDRSNAILIVCADSLSKPIKQFLDRAEFIEPATQCCALEGMLKCGYVMSTYGIAAWLTREAGIVLEVRRHVVAMLGKGDA